ncbi:hypothetical protein ACX5I6_05315 [Arthrobacter sp. MMS24-T111]
MIGIHDLGGFDNLGRVHPEHDGNFHEEWEKVTSVCRCSAQPWVTGPRMNTAITSSLCLRPTT